IRARNVTGVQTCALPILHHDISPLGTECDFFYSAVSEPHLNAPSKLPEANELPVTTANIFKHRASSRREPLAHCEASTCTHIRRSEERRVGKEYQAQEER